MMERALHSCSVIFLFVCASVAFAAEKAIPFAMPAQVEDLMANYCLDCHDGDTQKGDIRFDNLTELKHPMRLDMLNRMQEQVFFKQMPPKKKKTQPSEAERQQLFDWISGELRNHDASKLEDKLRKPEYGNYVDHDKLFSGEFKDLPGFTYDRRWLISEYIFNDKFYRMLQGQATGYHRGRKVPVFGSQRFHRQFTPTNPFLLPNRSGVRYYANTDLTGGHLSTMLTNAQKAAQLMTGYLVPRHKKSRQQYLPAVVQIMALEDRHSATLEARREFLETNIARVCQDLYGKKNDSLLPEFVPVVLNEAKVLEEGETYKKAPIHVAQNTLKNLGGEDALYQTLLNPDQRSERPGNPQPLRASVVLQWRPRTQNPGTRHDAPRLLARGSGAPGKERHKNQIAHLQTACR
jgi:hypothetical protein